VSRALVFEYASEPRELRVRDHELLVELGLEVGLDLDPVAHGVERRNTSGTTASAHRRW